jgi:uncharacterized membrane protein
MSISQERPPVNIKLTFHDWLMEFIGLAALIVLILLPLLNLSQLPERIPTHFNAAGIADGFGDKSAIWILPAVGGVLYLMLTVMVAFPQLYNYPVTITQQNAQVQYRLATRFVRILKTIILLSFIIICNKTIDTAIGKAAGLGKAFMPVFLIIIFGSIIIYFVIARNNQQNS